MVAINHNDADRFIAKPDETIFIYLLFGSDRGLVAERSLEISRNFSRSGGDVAQKIDLSGDAIAADPLVLVDEANSIDMFEQSRRVIRVGVGGKSPLKALEILAATPPENCLIILETGDLRRDAPLRKWAESQDLAAAIECQQDDARSVARLLEKELAAAGRSIEPSARDALLEVLGEDRIATRNEIQKLVLFTRDQNSISFADVEAICHDPSVSQTDAVVDAFHTSGRRDMLELWLPMYLSGIDMATVVLAVMRHALALQRGVGTIEAGGNQNDAMQAMFRAGGYNRKAAFQHQLRSTKSRDAVALVRIMQTFTKSARKDPTLLAQRLTRFLLSRPADKKHSAPGTR